MKTVSKTVLIPFFCAVAVFCCSFITAQEKPVEQKKNNAAAHAVKKPAIAKKNRSILTPGREAAALTFARLHHPELFALLEHLKKSSRPEYKRALRDLFQTEERLARLKENFPERYELELESWKLGSRIRLLAARMTMSDDPALEAELKAALLQRVDIRVQTLQLERDRLQGRVDKLNKTLEAIESDREAAAMKDLAQVKRGLRPSRKPSRKPKRGTDKTSSPQAKQTQK